MADFRKLLVWQKAHQLALDVERVAAGVARRKQALTRQLERAADSVPANIAEGRGRVTDADFAHFVAIAIGSVTEVESHLQRGYDAGVIPEREYTDLTESAIEVRKMLIGLRRTLRGQQRRPVSVNSGGASPGATAPASPDTVS
ncbi:four helix bundle protein [soil metagenome]